MFSLSISGHVYLIILVYQSRLSVSPSGRIQLLRSL